MTGQGIVCVRALDVDVDYAKRLGTAQREADSNRALKCKLRATTGRAVGSVGARAEQGLKGSIRARLAGGG